MMKNDERNWYVVQTRPRYEKKVYEQIKLKTIEAYLPLVLTIRKWSDRKKKVMIPMFSGYLFVHANEEERIEAIKDTVGALKYIFYRNKPAIVSEKELNNIKLSLQAPERFKIENTNIKKGDLVKVTGGIFTGMEGIVTELRGSYKFTINILELSMSLNVILNSKEVKLLEKINN
jgi:transcription antitermination factor NusG